MDLPADFDLQKMQANAERTARFLKSIASAPRLMILCNLVEGEKSSGELAELLDLSAANTSQHLSKLRSEGLVDTRRDKTTIFYQLAPGDVHATMSFLYSTFCKD